MKRGEIPSIGALTSFVAAAQHGSFTRAGGQLKLTQGAVSRQIQELESRLGIRLFERVRQRVVLTDAGRVYLADVKRVLDDLALATRKVVSFSNSTSLNLIVLPTFAERWLIPRLPKFQERNPRVTISITASERPVDFAVEPFDAAVYNDPSNWPGTVSHHLMDTDMVAVCSPRLNAKSAIKCAADVTKFPLLHKRGMPNRWLDWMAQAGMTPDAPLSGHAYENFAMLAEAAAVGLGISLLPRYRVEEDIRRGRLEIVASEFAVLEMSYYLLVPEGRASSGAVENFTRWLRAEAQAPPRSERRSTRTKEAARRLNGSATA